MSPGGERSQSVAAFPVKREGAVCNSRGLRRHEWVEAGAAPRGRLPNPRQEEKR
jgi:hypothetical protein